LYSIPQKRLTELRKVLVWLLVLLSVLPIGHWLYLGGRRFLYPYEILWMKGSMLDQILRIMQGKSLYQAPSVEYVPGLYQPFYYYLTALIAKVAGLNFTSARIISIVSILATGSMITFIVHKKTIESKFLALIGTGLFDNILDTIPGYDFKYKTMNLHKAQALADTMIYVYLRK
jgi:hypothetical protein